MAAGSAIAVGLTVWFLAGAGAWSGVVLLRLRFSTAGSAEEERAIRSEVEGRDLTVAQRTGDLSGAALLMRDDDGFGGAERSVSNRGP